MSVQANVAVEPRAEPRPLAPRSGAAARRAIDRALLDEVDEYFEAGARVSPGDVVVDVGANVGAFAMRAAERAEGDLTVHCFEPAPSIYAELRANVAGHPELRRASTTTWCLALTRTDLAGRDRDFYLFTRAPTNSTYDLAQKRTEHEEYFAKKAARLEAGLARRAPIVGAALGRAVRRGTEAVFRRGSPLGTWLSDRYVGLRVLSCKTESLERWAHANGVARIDLLKIDVEGAELDVLLGCDSIWPRIGSVAVETYDKDGRVEEVMSLLRARGLTIIRRFRPRITEQSGLGHVLLVAHRSEAASGAGAHESEGSR